MFCLETIQNITGIMDLQVQRDMQIAMALQFV